MSKGKKTYRVAAYIDEETYNKLEDMRRASPNPIPSMSELVEKIISQLRRM